MTYILDWAHGGHGDEGVVNNTNLIQPHIPVVVQRVFFINIVIDSETYVMLGYVKHVMEDPDEVLYHGSVFEIFMSNGLLHCCCCCSCCGDLRLINTNNTELHVDKLQRNVFAVEEEVGVEVVVGFVIVF